MTDGQEEAATRRDPLGGPADAGRSAQDLGGRVVAGLRWKMTTQVTVQVTRIGVAVLLARLLTPREFGLAGMVLVFSALAVVLSDVALGAALVRKRTISEDDRCTAFWATLAGGALLTLIGVAVSGPIAGFYGEPDVQPLFAAVSLSFLVTAIGATQAALMIRDMNFRGLEIRMMVGTFVGAVVAVVLALLDYGAWAIIGQQLTLAVVSSALLWRFSTWRPRLRFSPASARDLGGFGAKVFGVNLLNYGNRNADNLLVGRFLGASALGVYALAYNLMLLPLNRIVSPLSGVLFPAFSRMQDDRERTARVWIRANRMICALIAPAMFGLLVLAPDVIPTVVGPQWDDAVPVIQVLTWVGLLQALQHLNGIVLQAVDRAGVQLRFAVVVFAAGMAGFVGGLPFGLLGVATGFAIATTIVQPVYTVVTCRAIAMSPARMLRALSGVVQAAALMAVALLAARAGLLQTPLPTAARLVILVALGGVAYLACCWWRAPGVVDELRGLRSRRRSAPSAAPAGAEPGLPASDPATPA